MALNGYEIKLNKQKLSFLFIFFLSTTAFFAAQKIDLIVLNAQNVISLDEFCYLTDIHVGKTVSADQFEAAKELLAAKKRFKSISLKINTENSKTTLVCDLEPQVILKKIRILSSINNKYQYEALYAIQAGECFDPEIHKSSLDALKKRLIFDGYLKGSVTSTIKHDEKTLTCTVTIYVHPGPRYYVNTANYKTTFLFKPTQQKIMLASISAALSGFLNPLIKKYQYNQGIVKAWNLKIKRILFNLGFLKTNVSAHATFNHARNAADIKITALIESKRYVTQGNAACSSREIFDCLSPHIGQNGVIQQSIAKHQIKLLYQAKGYWKPEIKIQDTQDTFKIIVSEKQQIKSCEVRIKTTEGKPFFLPFSTATQRTICSTEFIKNTLKKIRLLAQRRGYWDFEIKNTRIVFNHEQPRHCLLEITVSPSEQRMLDEIKVLNNNPAFKYRKKIEESLKNIPFDPEIISNLRTNILNDLYQAGFWHATVDCTLQSAEHSQNGTGKTGIIALCTINPGEQATCGKLILQGFTKLPFKQILKNCNISEGSVWEQQKILAARNQLHGLEIFEHIKLSPHQITDPKNPKHIIAQILDDDPYELRFKLGAFLSNQELLQKRSYSTKIAGTYLIKNPTNRADILTVTGQADWREQHVCLGYRIPDLLGENQINSFMIRSQMHRYLLNLTEQSKTIREKKIEFKIITTPPPILNESQFGWKAGIENSKLSQLHGNLNFNEELLDKNLLSLYVKPTYKKITLDESKPMSEGLITIAKCKIAFPVTSYGNSPSVRCLFKQLFAKNLGSHLGIKLTFRAGHLFADSAFSNIHPKDRFFLGGSNSIRGYSKDTVPPIGTYTMTDGTTGYTVQGGKSMLQLNSEVRFLILKDAELHFFYDRGALSQTSINQLLQNTYRTIGLGTKLYTPLGIVKFDIGWKLNLSFAEENTYNWHLSFSSSF